MDKETIINLTSSIQEKLDDESKAIISDDLGMLITANNAFISEIENKDKEINKLKETNEKIMKANASLLLQVPVINEENNSNEPEPSNNFSFKSAFDEKGRFK